MIINLSIEVSHVTNDLDVAEIFRRAGHEIANYIQRRGVPMVDAVVTAEYLNMGNTVTDVRLFRSE